MSGPREVLLKGFASGFDGVVFGSELECGGTFDGAPVIKNAWDVVDLVWFDAFGDAQG